MVTANPVGPLNTFVNGTPADAVHVNENFDEVKTAVDDNYIRAIAAQQMADEAVAGHTVDSDTQLSESQVDGFVENNGYALTADVQTNAVNVDLNTTNIATNAANIAANTSNTEVLQATLAAIQAFLCGDGVILPSLESCDDGNSASGDGCSQTCTIEPSFVCSGLPSVCSLPVDVRFIACSDGVSVEDTATGLVWERKATAEGVNNVNNSYSWSADITSTTPDGTVYTTFLAQLNTNGFAGHADWRLPTVGEMQSILIGEGVLAQLLEDPTAGLNSTGQSLVCYSAPCLDPDFIAHAGPASPSYPAVVNGLTDQVTSQYRLGVLPYWSSQTFLPEVSNAYGVNFGANARLPSNIQTPQVLNELPSGIQAISKESGAPQAPSNRREIAVFARAVRNGSCGP
jgi:cysteine-rich repeat protein